MHTRNNIKARFGVAHLTALELPPLELARASARAGYSSIGLRIAPAAPGAIFYDLLPQTSALRELKNVLPNEGISVNEIEFIPLIPNIKLANLEPLLETGAELNAKALTVSGDDEDSSRLADTLANLCAMAEPFGLRIDVEFMKWRSIATYEDAVALLQKSAHPNVGILLDTLHLDRSGGDFKTPDLTSNWYVRSVQLCDAVNERPVGDENTIIEAREGRLVPGAGSLPLRQLVTRLEPDTYVSVEVPDTGRTAEERLLRAAQATRTLLEKEGNTNA